MRGVAAGVLAMAAVAAPSAAHAQNATVEAQGNAFSGGLRFQPADVAVAVGEVVRWRNVDVLVPHTATERSGLWDLSGTYGQTPANPPGFGPGESRERAFEAGTHRYFCRVHPAQMQGSVAVPVRLEAASTVVERKPSGRARKRRRVRVVWAAQLPAEGHGFDVEIRRGDGDWRRWRDGKRAAAGTFRTQAAKAPWSVRARLRQVGDAKTATDWSPIATISG